jgi:putative SOS response-associated peptidase YedK
LSVPHPYGQPVAFPHERDKTPDMCGRFVATRASGDLLPDLLDEFDPLRDDFNVAPTRDVALVRERDGERSMLAVHWG